MDQIPKVHCTLLAGRGLAVANIVEEEVQTCDRCLTVFRSRKLRIYLNNHNSVDTTASEYGQAPVTGLGEVATMTELRARFPSLRPLPLVNDEADPEVGWWRARAWRAGVSYPVAVAFNIINHRRRYFGQGHRDIRQLSSLTIENESQIHSMPKSQIVAQLKIFPVFQTICVLYFQI